jgi:integrase
VKLDFKLRKRPGSPNYQAFKIIKSKPVPVSTKTANIELAAEYAAGYYAKVTDTSWTESAKDVVIAERKNWSSIQDCIDAFELACKGKKVITKKNKPLGLKSVSDYSAGIRLILGFGNDQSVKGVPAAVTDALRKIPVSVLGDIVDGDKCKVVETYRRKVLSDGNGDVLTCGPTYEKKAATFNSNLAKAKALFSDNVAKVAYRNLTLPKDAIKLFRSANKCGVSSNKGYVAPPREVVKEVDDRVIALRNSTDFSLETAASDETWNHVVKYFIARLSGLRKEELSHLSFGSFRLIDKVARNPLTNEIKDVKGLPHVEVATTDPYKAGNGTFKQIAWEAKGKEERFVQIPRWLFDFVKAEQKRRKANREERILRGQHRWSAKTIGKQHDTWWNEELLYGTHAADYFKKRLHELRALFGSEVVTNTGSMHAAQLALGHQNISTTEKHYAHLLVDYNFQLNIGA